MPTRITNAQRQRTTGESQSVELTRCGQRQRRNQGVNNHNNYRRSTWGNQNRRSGTQCITTRRVHNHGGGWGSAGTKPNEENRQRIRKAPRQRVGRRQAVLLITRLRRPNVAMSCRTLAAAVASLAFPAAARRCRLTPLTPHAAARHGAAYAGWYAVTGLSPAIREMLLPLCRMNEITMSVGCLRHCRCHVAPWRYHTRHYAITLMLPLSRCHAYRTGRIRLR